MSDETKVPWPVWALVTVICTCITAYSVIYTARQSPYKPPSTDVESIPSPEVESTPSPEVESTPSHEVESTPSPEVESTPSPEVESTPSTEVESTPFTELTVLNELAPTQISEDVQVYMNSQLVAQLLVNKQKPTASAKVAVSSFGNYSYSVIADGYFMNSAGQIERYQGRGDGVIEVSQGSIFTITLTEHGLRLVPSPR